MENDYVPLNLNKKYCECLCSGGYINLLTLLWKTGCMGCLLCQNILVVNQKNGCLSCLICTPWNQNFHFQPMNWWLMLYNIDSMCECFSCQDSKSSYLRCVLMICFYHYLLWIKNNGCLRCMKALAIIRIKMVVSVV